MSEEKKEVIARFRTSKDGISATGHMGSVVSLSVARYTEGEETGFFIESYAQLKPALARELASALVQAADFAEGKER